MRNRATPGALILAFAVMGLGVISLLTGHFAAVWEPVPKGLPARHALAYANGGLMLLLGAGLLRRRTRVRAALTLSAYFVLWFFLLHLPIVAAAPAVADGWAGFGECATLVVGGLMVFASATAQEKDPWAPLLSGVRGVRFGRVLFALATLLMSLDNLAYPKGNADFPPAWIPHWIGWGYLVGIGFIATGLAVLSRILARLATCLAAWMMSLLTLGCWVSFVIEAPGHRLNWTGLMISSALSGAGWLVTESYYADRWLELPWRRRDPAPLATGGADAEKSGRRAEFPG